MTTPIKDLPLELRSLIEARYVQQKRREGILSCDSLSLDLSEWNVGSLFTWSETPEYSIDPNFWSRVNIGDMTYVLTSPAYPKAYGIGMDIARKHLDKIISDKQFYDKYWI